MGEMSLKEIIRKLQLANEKFSQPARVRSGEFFHIPSDTLSEQEEWSNVDTSSQPVWQQR